MSTTVIFLIGLVAANLCLAFSVITFIELRRAAAEATRAGRSGKSGGGPQADVASERD